MNDPTIVYLIDDDNDDLDFFREAVNSIDSSIVCVTSDNSDAALSLFRKHHIPVPDLIFLDLNMPLVDGRRFLTEIKHMDLYAKVPVIVYSTSSHPKDIEDTTRLGASYFMTKPTSMQGLVDTLSEVLGHHRAVFH